MLPQVNANGIVFPVSFINWALKHLGALWNYIGAKTHKYKTQVIGFSLFIITCHKYKTQVIGDAIMGYCLNFYESLVFFMKTQSCTEMIVL